MDTGLVGVHALFAFGSGAVTDDRAGRGGGVPHDRHGCLGGKLQVGRHQ